MTEPLFYFLAGATAMWLLVVLSDWSDYRAIKKARRRE
jgi:hypothetical protein